MDTLLEALIESPDLPQKLEAAQRVLTQERKLRERFYDEMREDQKIEFINGEVIMQSPAKLRHIEVSDSLHFLLTFYVKHRDLGLVAHEKLLVSLSRNDYEPDVSFFRKEKAAAFTPEQMQFPAPDFIAEVLSPSTERFDRRTKKRDYALHGVGEYWLIDPEAQTIEQHTLDGEDYRLLGVWKGDDPVASTAMEGFCIPARAIFERQANLEALAALAK
jgi:Uma2 family endonuclease